MRFAFKAGRTSLHICCSYCSGVERKTSTGRVKPARRRNCRLTKRVGKYSPLAYYNCYGNYYYHLVTQSGPREGSKETFSSTALVLNAPFTPSSSPPILWAIDAAAQFSNLTIQTIMSPKSTRSFPSDRCSCMRPGRQNSTLCGMSGIRDSRDQHRTQQNYSKDWTLSSWRGNTWLR